MHLSNPLSVLWFYDMNALKKPAGVTRHAVAMRHELEKQSQRVQLRLCTGRIQDPDILAMWERWDTLPHFELPLTSKYMIRLWRLYAWPPITAWSGQADWIYTPAEFFVAKGKSRLAVTSHDIVQDLNWQPARRKALLDQLFPQADLVLSVSKYNTKALVQAYPYLEGRVYEVPNAADDLFYEPATEAERRTIRSQLGLPVNMPYLISVANFQPRKNLGRLITAMAQVPEVAAGELALVLVGEGSPQEIEALHASIRNTGKPKMQVRMTGYIQGAVLRSAYAEASSLVFPSLCESFGIPALEAMSQGCPVALADTTSLPEIGREAGWYFQPTSEDSISEAVRSLLSNAETRQERVQRGVAIAGEYRWKNSAEKLIRALESASGIT